MLGSSAYAARHAHGSYASKSYSGIVRSADQHGPPTLCMIMAIEDEAYVHRKVLRTRALRHPVHTENRRHCSDISDRQFIGPLFGSFVRQSITSEKKMQDKPIRT